MSSKKEDEKWNSLEKNKNVLTRENRYPKQWCFQICKVWMIILKWKINMMFDFRYLTNVLILCTACNLSLRQISLRIHCYYFFIWYKYKIWSWFIKRIYNNGKFVLPFSSFFNQQSICFLYYFHYLFFFFFSVLSSLLILIIGKKNFC